MPFRESVLWIEDGEDLETFMDKAVEIKVSSVAVKGTNNMPSAIELARLRGLKVYLWRYPLANQISADAAANQAISLLRPVKTGGPEVDGYFFDPEGSKVSSQNWDTAENAAIALSFCQRVSAVAEANNKPFGITSHYFAGDSYPNLKWKQMFAFAKVLLPQAYWRDENNQDIYKGKPAENFKASLEAWERYGGARSMIVPMGGDICRSTSAEIHSYAAAASANGIDVLHFYHYRTDGPTAVTEDVWEAIKDVSDRA